MKLVNLIGFYNILNDYIFILEKYTFKNNTIHIYNSVLFRLFPCQDKLFHFVFNSISFPKIILR